MISLQNTKINNNFFSSENKFNKIDKNITDTKINYGTNNLNITAFNEKDREKKRIDRKINCKNNF